MKHWNCSETANVCKNCGFQTFSLPVYKRHTKHCAENSDKVEDMNCQLPNGGTKEPPQISGSKESQEALITSKPQASGSKYVLYCKLCQFSCNFSSQLIGHIKKVHTSENRIIPDQTASHPTAVGSATDSNHHGENQPNNGLLPIKQEAEEQSIKKEIVLKKIKLEISEGEGAAGGPLVKDRAVLSGEAKTVKVEREVDEEKSRKCPECGFVARNRDQMMSHRTEHVASSAVVYSCNECEYKTHVRKNFERHEWCHVVDGPFKCLLCSFSSNGENAIKRHMTSYHADAEPGRVGEEEEGEKRPAGKSGGKKGKVEAKAKAAPIFPRQPIAILPKQPKPEVRTDQVCPHCGLCFPEKSTLDHHVKTKHLTSQFQPGRGQQVRRDQLSVQALPPSKTGPFQSVPKISVKVEAKPEEKSKVYMCGYCSLSFCEFGRLREHMEGNACQPSPIRPTGPISDTAPRDSERPSGEETVLQKLLTNDNPNKVYPKVPLISLVSKGPTLPVVGASNPQPREEEDGEDRQKIGNGHSGESIRTSKTYISCLLCVYKTLSVKVLRKHLVKEHPTIICSKKILKEVIQKSILVSSPKQTSSTITAPTRETSGGGEVLLRWETENNPPAPEGGDGRLTSGPRNHRPFKCSECGMRSDWKHIVKKHIQEKHEGAVIVVLSPEEAEATFESYRERFARNVATRAPPAGGSVGPEGAVGRPGGELGMTDHLRLKRFKCSVCIYRSNFRCDIGRHLKKRHPDVPDCHYTVMPAREAVDTLAGYRYTWPEAEALLVASLNGGIKDELGGEGRQPQEPPADRRAVPNPGAAFGARLPFGSEDGKRCNICPFVTNKAELLRLHMAYHQPQKRNCYSCPHCPYFVNTPRLLQHHIALHDNDQLVKSVAAERNATQQLNAYNLEFNHVKRNPKFICEDCPYTSNNRNEFWRHRKGHFERGVVPGDLKCQHCPYWAEDRRDWHLHCSLHGGMQKNLPSKRTDLAIGEFCRCDLADLNDFPDLACFRELRCPCCTVRGRSVARMRHHVLGHVAFVDAIRYRIFDRALDQADEPLGNLCTRLLNMNYSLAEECRGDLGPAGVATAGGSAEDEDTQMPVLERVTEMSEQHSAPDLSLTFRPAPSSLLYSSPSCSSSPSFASSSSRYFPQPTFYSGRCSERLHLSPVGCGRVRPSADPGQHPDEYVMSAPEEVVEWDDAAFFASGGDDVASVAAATATATTTEVNDTGDDDDGDLKLESSVVAVDRDCPHSKILFLLSLGVVPSHSLP